MNHSTFIEPDESRAIDQALKSGDAERAFTMLAAYLGRNRFSLSDDIFKLYLEQELFDCLKDRGDIFHNI